MPKTLLWAFLLGLFLPAQAQFLAISGRVDQNLRDSIEVNVPFVGEYYKSNSVFAPIDSGGKFSVDIRFGTSKFVQILYGKEQQWVLLTPGRPLFVELNPESAGIKFVFQGEAKKENNLLQELEPGAGVFFTQKNVLGKIDVKYLAWSADSIRRYLLPSIKNEIAEKRKIISNSRLPNTLRQTLWVDIGYYYANQFTKFESAWIKRNGIRVWAQSFAGTEIDSFPVPSQKELGISQSADEWFIMYCTSSSVNSNYRYNLTQDKKKADSQFLRQVGFSYKYLVDTLTKEFGGQYAEGKEGYQFSPEFARDRWLAFYIELECELSDVKSAQLLLNTLQDSFPSSSFLAPCMTKVSELVLFRAEHENSNAIHIRSDYKNISTLNDLLAPYKGRVVYMDLWGTWCGPCADEMQFVPQLQRHFKDKDIVFLYVDDDDDKYDQKWRDYLAIRDIEGEHVRLNKNQLTGIWEKLTSAEHRNNYPSYFIIDKDGNVSIALSKRPSDQAALYEQIAEVLNR